MLPPPLHPPVEGTPIREVEVRRPRLPCARKVAAVIASASRLYSAMAALHSSLSSTSKRSSYRSVRSRSRKR